MKFPTQHNDLKQAWLYLLDNGQQDHADCVFQFARMFKENYEQMRRFQDLANKLQRKNNQDDYETKRRQTIKRYSESRRAANE